MQTSLSKTTAQTQAPESDAKLREVLEALTARATARSSIKHFVQQFTPSYVSSPFGDHLCKEIDSFVASYERGESPRLMIFAPPRHGKSQIVSRALPAYLLGRNPKMQILAASASQEFADEFGLFVKNLLNDPLFADLFPDCRPDPSSNAVSRFSTVDGGSYRAVGVGVQIVGRGADCLIIDDPVKGRAEAYSATARMALSNWYKTSARTRLQPNGAVIIMHQRWHPEDLAGEIQRISQEKRKADQFRVLVYPAIAEEDDIIGRKPGEPLDPVRWPLHALEAWQAGMPEADWLALFQQRPVRAEGGFFKADWFRFYMPKDLPKSVYWYIGVDFAVSTSSYADSTSIVPYAIDSERNLYLAPDFVLERLEPLDAAKQLLDLVAKYKPLFVASEKGVIQRVMAPILKSLMRERNQYCTIHEIVRSDAKHIIASTFQSRMQQGKVFFPDNNLIRHHALPQLLNFIPDADNTHDDFIDASSNLCVMIDKLVPPVPPPVAPKVSDEDEEEALWNRIMACEEARSSSSVPFRRLNGSKF